jgi:hypothetical protein
VRAPGTNGEEVLISTHACHPGMCNDNLSGVAVAWATARALQSQTPRFTYRILFIPTIIGSIAWLARNESTVQRIHSGLVLACVGDGGAFHYKRSRRSDAPVDRAAAHVLSWIPPAGMWRISFPTDTTSATTARRASTCPSVRFRVRRTDASRSITPPPTTLTTSVPSTWPDRSMRALPFST